MSPSRASNAADVQVSIAGEGLTARLTTDFNNHEESGFSTAYTARLDDTELKDVRLVAGGGLLAVVPAGIPAGAHELVVTDPWGRTGKLANAYEAVDPADVVTAIAFATPPQTVKQGQCSAEVTVEARNAADLPRPVEQDVALAVSGASLQPFSDPGCASPLLSLQLANGETRASFYFAGTLAGSPTLTVTANGFAPVSQVETVLALTPCDGVPEGGGCDDGDACTLGERCVQGSCTAVDTVSCAPLDACHNAGTCNPLTGLCSNPAKPDGAPCDDGVSCTTGEMCVQGVCGFASTFSSCANTAPTACLSVTPVAALVGSARTFSADCSTDLEQPANTLEARFDFEGDGTFDTPFGTTPQSFAYTAPGLYEATVEVRDLAGVSAFSRKFVAAVDPSADVLVTTAAAEQDNNATPTNPRGTGLSLQEAVAYANSTGGNKTIRFDGGMQLSLASLPKLTASNVAIVGEPGTTIDFSSGVGSLPCLVVDGADASVIGLGISGCKREPVTLNGANGRLAECDVRGNQSILVAGTSCTVGPRNELHDFNGEALRISGSAVVVRENTIRDNGGSGLRLLAGSGAGSFVQRNVIARNGGSGILIEANVGAPRVCFNTVDSNTGDGVQALGPVSPPLDARNNVFTRNRAPLNVAATAVAFATPNLSFGNRLAGSVDAGLSADPLFVSADGGDLRIRLESAAVNAGVGMGVDVNGPAAGDFNGSAPDLGAYETP